MALIIGFLLDETGSMQSIKDDTIGGFNSYVDTLRKEAAGKTKFTLVKFDSSKLETVCDGAGLADVPRLSDDNYKPGAMTPLIDASVKIINLTAKKTKKKDKVVVVIQTDGFENASKKHSREDLANLVKEKEKVGWQFVFIGANMDAFAEAQKYGFSPNQTMSYTDSGAAMAAVASNTVNYARGASQDTAFSQKQRKQSGEKAAQS